MHRRPRTLILSAIVLSWSVIAYAQDDLVQQARAKIIEWERLVQEAQSAQTQEQAQAAFQKSESTLTEAMSLFRQGNAGESEDPETLHDYARALAVTGDFDLAAEVFQRITRIAPDAPSHWSFLARTLMELGGEHLEEAQQALDKALTLTEEPKEKAEIHTLMAGLYLREKLFSLARREFLAALELVEGFLPARLGLAILDVRDGRMASASGVIDEAATQPLVAGEFIDRNLSAALDAFERSRLSFPDTAEEHAGYGKLLLRSGKEQLAAMAFQRATQLDPTNYVLWNFLASAHRLNGHEEEAKAAYTKSLAIHPDQPRTRQELQSLGQRSFGPLP